MNCILPEWHRHDALWTAWPSHDDADRWPGDMLAMARAEIAQMVRHMATGEHINVVACGEEAVISAREAIGDVATIIPAKFGDIWLRDTGPIFTYEDDTLVALRFQTNGWGGKYLYEHDDVIGDTIAQKENATIRRHDFVLEGGSIEHDGNGLIMTTRECLLNDNRNPGWDQATAEDALKSAFNATRIIWLDEGLMNDHTDGHIDNIARFIAPNHAICQRASGEDDPNTKTFKRIYRTLREAGVEVTQIPSPGMVRDSDGEIAPASHMNFIIGNGAVVVPVYDTPYEQEAIAVLQGLFPHKNVVDVPSTAVLTGGGSFHCITQHIPARKNKD